MDPANIPTITSGASPGSRSAERTRAGRARGRAGGHSQPATLRCLWRLHSILRRQWPSLPRCLMLTSLNVVHALLYLIVSLLAVAVVFYVIGAPFVAALEVIIYAGAIMVLFVFVVMMLNLGEHARVLEKSWLTPGIWIGPTVLSGLLLCEVALCGGARR